MDASQFKQYFLPCHEKMFRMAWRLTGNVQIAEDLVQEAFLRLWMKRNELPAVESFEAFSVTTVKHLFYDQQRKRQPLTTDRMPEQLQMTGGGYTDTTVEEADEQMLVMRLIEKLPQQQRQIIMMRDIEEMDYEEIEQQTGLAAVHIRVLLSRARKQIRQQLREITNDGCR